MENMFRISHSVVKDGYAKLTDGERRVIDAKYRLRSSDDHATLRSLIGETILCVLIKFSGNPLFFADCEASAVDIEKIVGKTYEHFNSQPTVDRAAVFNCLATIEATLIEDEDEAKASGQRRPDASNN